MSTIPAAPTDEIYPVYVDLTNNWRAVDAHWIRDRLVHVFDDAAERTTVIGGSARQGMLTYLKGTDSLEFRKASVWESVRYPNLTVTSDATTINLRRTGAGSGMTLKSDGSTEITTLFAGTGGIGNTLDATGHSIKVGAKTAKLTTDATQMLLDSPLSVTGDVTSSAALKGASATLTGALTAASGSITGTLTVTALTASGTVNAGLVNVTDAELAMSSGLALFRNKQSAANRLSFSSTGDAILTGATVTINGAVTSTTKSFFNSGVDMLANVSRITGGGMTPAPVAGVVPANRAPTSGDNYPDGTIWIQY